MACDSAKSLDPSSTSNRIWQWRSNIRGTRFLATFAYERVRFLWRGALPPGVMALKALGA